MELANLDLSIQTLGPAEFPNPLCRYVESDGDRVFIRDEADRINMDIRANPNVHRKHLSFESAGAREKLYFEPGRARAAIVTCGGLCPGLNDVIRSVVRQLHLWYDVKKVYGIRFGFGGLSRSPEYPPMELDLEAVVNIQQVGGTILGSARGKPDTDEIVDTLLRWKINMLFCVGGDGTLRGADEIADEIERRGLKIAVIGIPKTIDNDVPFVYRSFGYQTAVEEARHVLECAHVEANGVKHGVGLVKLMGRDAGFVTASAALSNGDVNYCLIPEMSVPIQGENGLLEHLRRRLKARNHALIAVAEGALQSYLGESGQTDASGNKVYNDAGRWLGGEIEKAFREWGEEVNVKYFSPSYSIRSVPANGDDRIFCADLGRHATHAAMAGKTRMLVGFWHGEFTHVPLKAIYGMKKRVKRDQSLWVSVLTSTGQPVDWW